MAVLVTLQGAGRMVFYSPRNGRAGQRGIRRHATGDEGSKVQVNFLQRGVSSVTEKNDSAEGVHKQSTKGVQLGER